MAPGGSLASILGDSPAIAALRDQIRHLAAFDAPGGGRAPTVLLQGATGTGKGLVARVMHHGGPRAAGPFIDVNCAAIPETMLEAELFGFEAGAFTDAKRAKPGLFEAASGGTLFLDEIDSLPLALQGKVLKAIEEKHVRRLGATTGRRVDPKLVAATQQDLRALVAAGRFRADLYHRIAVLVLTIPPLAERGDDVVLLARRFLAAFAAAHGVEPKRLDASALAWLRRSPWPGNVRELEHAMERVTLLGEGADVNGALLERLAGPAPRAGDAPGERRDGETPAPATDAEIARIRGALARAGGNVSKAARALGIGRNALRYRMRVLGIARAETDADTVPSAPAESDAPVDRGAPVWEQRPVAVLVIAHALPEIADAPAFEPWTATVRWEETMAAKILAFGGLVLGRSPGRTTAVFGLPRALEQAAERAVQAALAVGRAAAAAEPRATVRIAAHMGEVRVDASSERPGERLLPIGDVLVLPERLLGHAAAGEVLVSAPLARRVGPRCELAPRTIRLGPAERDAATVFSVTPARLNAPTSFAEGETRLVGREHELDLLADAFERAERGGGQVVFVVGDAGIGKSRLLLELRRRLAGVAHRWVEGRCASYGTTTPFLPVIDAIRRDLELDDRDDDATITAKLERALARLGPEVAWTLPFVQQLLSLEVADEAIRALDAAHRRSELVRALGTLILRSAEVEPLVLVIEDLHWIDPASEELLAMIADSVATARVLVVLSHRVGYRSPFGDRSFHRRVTLGPLSADETRVITGALFSDAVVDDEVHALVAARAEGNPFFVEELARWLLEDGSLECADGRVRLAHGRGPAAVPTSIQDVLVARIDRLAEESRHAIQVASVIGREFALRLLARITEAGERVRAQVDELRGLELIYEKAVHPEVAYMFKHALTHDVAYQSVLLERRKALHRTIGLAIEDLYADRLGEHYETLAHHFTRGEDWPRAFAYHEHAAAKAADRHANRAVVEHARSALEIAARLGEASAARGRRRRLEEQLGHAHLYLSAFRESGEAFERAAALAEAAEARSLLFSWAAFAHFWAHEYAAATRCVTAATAAAATPAAEAMATAMDSYAAGVLTGDLETFERVQEHALALARRGGNGGVEAFVQMNLVMAAEWSGRYREALAHAAESSALGRAERLPELVILPLWFESKARCCLGQFGPAIAQLEEMYALCARIGDRAWSSRLLNTLGWCWAEIGQVERAREHNERAAVLAAAIGDPEILANAAINLARNHLALGEATRAADALAPITATLECDGDPWMRWRWALHVREVQARLALAGRVPDRALAITEAALAAARRLALPKIAASLQLVRGDALLALERWDDARAAGDDALATSGTLGWARGCWQAHAVLAEQSRRRGRDADAAAHAAAARRAAESAAGSLPDAALRARLLASVAAG